MPKKHTAACAFIAALLTTNADCTSLVVGRSGNHIIVGTNSIDTDGNSRCKLHFSKNAVVMRATQAASISFTWPNGHTETVDFEAAMNERLRDLDEPIDRLEEILVQDAKERIRAILQHYQPGDADRTYLARDLVSEYVIVGREHNGFLGVRAFTLKVVDPPSITFEVKDIASRLRDGEIIDYTHGETNTANARGQKAVSAAIYARLENHSEVAQSLGNKAFSPPYLVMDVTRSGRSYVSDPGPCRI